MPLLALGPRVERAAFEAVAVAEQHWKELAVGLDAHPEATEQIGSVGMEGDAPEALGLALGGDHAAADVHALDRKSVV